MFHVVSHGRRSRRDIHHTVSIILTFELDRHSTSRSRHRSDSFVEVEVGDVLVVRIILIVCNVIITMTGNLDIDVETVLINPVKIVIVMSLDIPVQSTMMVWIVVETIVRSGIEDRMCCLLESPTDPITRYWSIFECRL